MSIRSELVFVTTLLCLSAAACGSLFAKKDDAFQGSTSKGD